MFNGIDSQRSIHGAWRLMTGRSDGLRMLDLTADGFWNSFFAIVVAMPALALGWVVISGEFGPVDITPAGRTGIVVRLAITDLASWLVPIGVFAAFAGPAGLADRFVAYIVAANWGSTIVIWMTLPATLLWLIAPGAADLLALVSLVLFGITMALTWRLTNAAIDRGPAVATAVFGGMFVASLATQFGLQALLGLS